MDKFFILLVSIFPFIFCHAQNQFQTVHGGKANYTIEIPNNFNSKNAIGANVDLKFGDKNGAAIVTVIKKLPPNVNDEQIAEMSYPSDLQVVNQFENNGMQNVSLIKRGFIFISGVKSYFIYYTASVDGTTLYYHTINQFVNGKMLNLTISCEYSNKASYMPYIYRIVNSIKYN